MLLVPLFMFIHWLFTLQVELFPAWEIALAIVTTSLIFRYVDPDRPARMVIRTALTDWRHTREPSDRAARPPPRRQQDRIREELQPVVSPTDPPRRRSEGCSTPRSGDTESDGSRASRLRTMTSMRASPP